jgi:hypothetical protein
MRFCRSCGCELQDKYLSGDSTPYWFHPVVDGCDLEGELNRDQITSNHCDRKPLEMDDLREVWRKIVHTKWYRDHKEVVSSIYAQHHDDVGKQHAVNFQEEISNDHGNVVADQTQAGSSDGVGIAYEPATYESPERIKFWRKMVWWITYNPTKAYDLAIRSLGVPETELMSEDEAVWVVSITNGMRNKPMFRYAQFLLMQNKALRRNNRWLF